MSDVETNPLPFIGTIWSYRKHPDRLYEVMYLANVASDHADHPPVVVYRSVAHSAYVYTREAQTFCREFTLVEEPRPPVVAPLHYQRRCANALRTILSFGKPDLSRSKYQPLLAAADEALVAFDTFVWSEHGKVPGGWEASQWVSNPRGYLLVAPDGTSVDLEPDDCVDEAGVFLRKLAQAMIVEQNGRVTPALLPTAGTPHPIEDVAHTVVRVDYQPTDGNEAYDSQFDGTYVLYCVCPARTRIEAVTSKDHLQLDYADDHCTIFSVHVL